MLGSSRKKQRELREKIAKEEVEMLNRASASWWNGSSWGSGMGTPPVKKRINPLQAEYDLIECDPWDVDENVIKAYRTAAKRHHPDLIRARGGAGMEVDAANIKMHLINAAWEKIKKERNL